MGLLGGLIDLVGGIIDIGGSSTNTFVSTHNCCPKCGAFTHGVSRYCESCNRERISSGISEIKQAQKDPIIEAEKRGCERATRIYRETFEQLKCDLKQLEQSISDLETDVAMIRKRAEELSEVKSLLKREYESLLSRVAAKHQVSEYTLANALGSSQFMYNPIGAGTVFELLYRNKERKIREAEQRGFEDGKRIYEEKIMKVREKIIEKSKKLKQLSIRAAPLRYDAPTTFDQTAKEILNYRMKIAALKCIE